MARRAACLLVATLAGCAADAKLKPCSRDDVDIDAETWEIGHCGMLVLAATGEQRKYKDAAHQVKLTRRLTDADASRLALALKANPQISMVNLRHNAIGPAGAEALALALEGHPGVTIITFSGNTLGDTGIEAIAALLKGDSALTEVDLWDTAFGAKGAEALGEAISVNTKLKKLLMGNSAYGDAGAGALADGLRTNRALIYLDVRHAAIGDAGAEALAEAVTHADSRLDTLDLGVNALTVTGATALVAAQSRLSTLNFGGNAVGPLDGNAVALLDDFLAAIEGNTKVQRLFLGDNKLDEASCERLVDAYEAHPSLVDFMLIKNEASEELLERIADLKIDKQRRQKEVVREKKEKNKKDEL